MHFIERRIPATLPPAKRRTTRESRYFLRDPYLRFYYRFIDPNLHHIERGLTRRLWRAMEESFRAFVGETFEALARECVLALARTGRLAFEPEFVGAHWDLAVQVDVVAINWQTRDILLGEAKWGETDRPDRRMIRGLLDKADRVVPQDGSHWNVHYAVFARDRITRAARAELSGQSAIRRD